jgi:hypothetical protein
MTGPKVAHESIELAMTLERSTKNMFVYCGTEGATFYVPKSVVSGPAPTTITVSITGT